MCICLCAVGCKKNDDTNSSELSSSVTQTENNSTVNTNIDEIKDESEQEKVCIHQFEIATCTSPQVCKKCGITQGTSTEHTFGEWSISKKASCTIKGIEVRKCVNCDEKETREIAASHNFVGIKCSNCSACSVDILKLNTPYKDKNGLTVTLNSYTVTEQSGYYSHSINYTIKNEVPDSKLMEGSFKLFFTDKTGEPQYGGFDYLFFGEESNRTYEWKVLKNQKVSVLEYNAEEPDSGLDGAFFRNEPIASSLHWLAP